MNLTAFLRTARAAVLLCAPAAAFAQASYELPAIDNPQARALLERTGMTPQKLQTLWQFAKPAEQPWPCEVPRGVLLEAVGLFDAVPDEELSDEARKHKADFARVGRKIARAHGTGASKDVYSNIVVLPVNAQCTDGKLHGEVEFFLAHDKESITESESYTPMTQKMEKSRVTMRISDETLHRMTFAQGKRAEGGSTALSRSKITMQTAFDNPDLQRGAARIEAQTGAATPQENFNANFNWPDGGVSLTPSISTEVSSGFLAPNVKVSKKLMTSVSVMGEKYMDIFTYEGAEVSGSSRFNKETKTMLSINNMDDVYKKLGQKRPDNADQKEVVINGKHMLETRMCMIDNKPAKVDPCPVD